MFRVLLITGEHDEDWKDTTPHLRNVLEEVQKFKVVVTEEPVVLETDALQKYDVLLMNYNRGERWPEKQEQALLDFVKNGKGLVTLHGANATFPDWQEYERMIGGGWREGSYHPPYGPFKVVIDDKEHEITKGMEDFETCDEIYSGLRIHHDVIRLLAHAVHDEKEQPMVWTVNYGKGRVFHMALGHDVPAMRNENFIKLLISGTEWAAKSLRGTE